ncbi:MAG: DUF4956 domain-containing protein [Deltaproteobacteria bacterium]|nr:DUF4956 domain-containing protein [Deltaproteobacteria bacterium]
MDQFLKEAQKFGDLTGAFTMMDVIIVLVLGFVLTTVLGFIYRYTHKGVSYSQNYVQTMVIMGCTIALIMLIVGSNIARAFALVGALSIVRFRNAMKETRDIGFIFMAMAIGMAVGTRFYMLATFATAMMSSFAVIMHRFNMFALETRELVLRVQMPVDRDFEEALNDPFSKNLAQYKIISIETVRSGVLQELIFSIVLKKNVNPKDLLESIRKKNDNHKVSIVLGQQEIDL